MMRNQRLLLPLGLSWWTLATIICGFITITQALQAPFTAKSRQQAWTNKGKPAFRIETQNNNKAHKPDNNALILGSRMRGSSRDGDNEATDINNTNSTDAAANDNTIISKGRGLLLLVAVLYGTLNVSLRLVYALDDPPTASALSATRGWLAALCFIPLLMRKKENNHDQNNDEHDDSRTPTTTTSTTTTTIPALSDVVVSLPLLMAGLELAVWNFGAQGLLNMGLLSTGSARASFLTQTSVVLTPIISMFAGQKVKSVVWFGCAVALGGLTLLSGGGAGAGITGGVAMGDVLVLGGALCWSLYLFRLSAIGERFDEIKLQALKTTILAVLYSAWLVWETTTSGACQWLGWQNLTAWALLLYSALGPGTVADVLQQQGQKEVSASEANVILSLEPVFAALCARVLMGETTSLVETIGGGLILFAALIATR
jgi:drug/metabolite transporter (DMT)-like permease